MKRCPISYEEIPDDVNYSASGLKMLDRRLTTLARLEFTAEQQRQEAMDRAGKMSVQGMQLKLSAKLNVARGWFEIVNEDGRFILKPPSRDYPELPENEDVTMRMAASVGIEVPVHGLLWAVDGSLTYFIKRFDRAGHDRLPQEDFAQIMGESRDTKYNSSMEKVAAALDRFCTFPAIEKVKLFDRTLFSFLIGNEDMHLKNFSLLTKEGKVQLTPAYDFLNSTIALRNPREELALPLNGKKSRLTRRDLVDYFGRERLQINEKILKESLDRFKAAMPEWNGLLEMSFLSVGMKEKFLQVIQERTQRIWR